jgi:glycosyltransferase involved in cell wall biosynthesis
MHLRRSLESVLGQEAVDFELIVVDDGSTDRTPSILSDMAATDQRVRVLRQENRGLTQALMLGCSHARGEFIARHDADDVSLPGRLSKQLVLLRSCPRVSFVSCWARALGPQDEVLFETTRPSDSRQATELLRGQRQGPCGHGSVMFRRSDYERVGGYRREFYFAQDTDLWLRLSEVGELAYVPETLYVYRVATCAISSSYRSVQHTLGDLSDLCAKARQNGESEDVLLSQAASMRPARKGSSVPDPLAGDYFVGRCLVRRGDPRARRYLWKVLEKRPWSVGAWLGVCQTMFFRGSAQSGA